MTKASPVRVAQRQQSTEDMPIPPRLKATPEELAADAQQPVSERLPTPAELRQYAIGSAQEQALTQEMGRLHVTVVQQGVQIGVLEAELAQKDTALEEASKLIAELSAKLGDG